MTKYHPVIIALHWLLALAIIFMLLAGSLVLSETPNSDPEKLNGLAIHMGLGIGILLLTLIRLAVRLRTGAPEPLEGSTPKQEKIASITHVLLYLGVIAMGVSGVAIALSADLGNIVFFGSGQPLPKDFEDFLPFEVHEIVSSALIGLVALHVAAAVFHQHFIKDGIMSRMSFRNK